MVFKFGNSQLQVSNFIIGQSGVVVGAVVRRLQGEERGCNRFRCQGRLPIQDEKPGILSEKTVIKWFRKGQKLYAFSCC